MCHNNYNNDTSYFEDILLEIYRIGPNSRSLKLFSETRPLLGQFNLRIMIQTFQYTLYGQVAYHAALYATKHG